MPFGETSIALLLLKLSQCNRQRDRQTEGQAQLLLHS